MKRRVAIRICCNQMAERIRQYQPQRDTSDPLPKAIFEVLNEPSRQPYGAVGVGIWLPVPQDWKFCPYCGKVIDGD